MNKNSLGSAWGKYSDMLQRGRQETPDLNDGDISNTGKQKIPEQSSVSSGESGVVNSAEVKPQSKVKIVTADPSLGHIGLSDKSYRAPTNRENANLDVARQIYDNLGDRQHLFGHHFSWDNTVPNTPILDIHKDDSGSMSIEELLRNNTSLSDQKISGILAPLTQVTGGSLVPSGNIHRGSVSGLLSGLSAVLKSNSPEAVTQASNIIQHLHPWSYKNSDVNKDKISDEDANHFVDTVVKTIGKNGEMLDQEGQNKALFALDMFSTTPETKKILANKIRQSYTFGGGRTSPQTQGNRNFLNEYFSPSASIGPNFIGQYPKSWISNFISHGLWDGHSNMSRAQLDHGIAVNLVPHVEKRHQDNDTRIMRQLLTNMARSSTHGAITPSGERIGKFLVSPEEAHQYASMGDSMKFKMSATPGTNAQHVVFEGMVPMLSVPGGHEFMTTTHPRSGKTGAEIMFHELDSAIRRTMSLARGRSRGIHSEVGQQLNNHISQYAREMGLSTGFGTSRAAEVMGDMIKNAISRRKALSNRGGSSEPRLGMPKMGINTIPELTKTGQRLGDEAPYRKPSKPITQTFNHPGEEDMDVTREIVRHINRQRDATYAEGGNPTNFEALGDKMLNKYGFEYAYNLLNDHFKDHNVSDSQTLRSINGNTTNRQVNLAGQHILKEIINAADMMRPLYGPEGEELPDAPGGIERAKANRPKNHDQIVVNGVFNKIIPMSDTLNEGALMKKIAQLVGVANYHLNMLHRKSMVMSLEEQILEKKRAAQEEFRMNQISRRLHETERKDPKVRIFPSTINQMRKNILDTIES